MLTYFYDFALVKHSDMLKSSYSGNNDCHQCTFFNTINIIYYAVNTPSSALIRLSASYDPDNVAFNQYNMHCLFAKIVYSSFAETTGWTAGAIDVDVDRLLQLCSGLESTEISSGAYDEI